MAAGRHPVSERIDLECLATAPPSGAIWGARAPKFFSNIAIHQLCARAEYDASTMLGALVTAVGSEFLQGG